MKSHEFANSSDDYIWLSFGYIYVTLLRILTANIEVQIVGSKQSLVGLVVVKKFSAHAKGYKETRPASVAN